MTDVATDPTLAPCFAFAGRAFLSTDRAALLGALEADEDAPAVPAEFSAALAGDPDDLEREYVRLFLSPLGAPCPPWQSANAVEPQLMGPAHHGALAWYQREGVEPAAANEPADHAGLLLLFYARLLNEGAEPHVLREFHEQHLAWLAPFCAAMEDEARHPFYRLLARWTSELVRS
jgi:putative dimethyl sulfoxide reductase chaperone